MYRIKDDFLCVVMHTLAMAQALVSKRNPLIYIFNSKFPKFEFYIYNDVGNIVKQHLSFRQIQDLLLRNNPELGMKYKRNLPINPKN